MKIRVGKKSIEIDIVVFKQQFSLYKHRYQTEPKSLKIGANKENETQKRHYDEGILISPVMHSHDGQL